MAKAALRPPKDEAKKEGVCVWGGGTRNGVVKTSSWSSQSRPRRSRPRRPLQNGEKCLCAQDVGHLHQ